MFLKKMVVKVFILKWKVLTGTVQLCEKPGPAAADIGWDNIYAITIPVRNASKHINKANPLLSCIFSDL